MDNLIQFENDNVYSDVFTKCFISLENLSDDIFSNFRCTVWNQPRQGMLNIRNRWQFDFYADTPFKAIKKSFDFIIVNVKSEFNIDYNECLKLRHKINDDNS